MLEQFDPWAPAAAVALKATTPQVVKQDAWASYKTTVVDPAKTTETHKTDEGAYEDLFSWAPSRRDTRQSRHPELRRRRQGDAVPSYSDFSYRGRSFVGNAKIQRRKESGNLRFLMRDEQTGRIVANHAVADHRTKALPNKMAT